MKYSRNLLAPFIMILLAALLLCSCANAIDEEAGQPQSNGINKTPALTVPNPDAIDQIVPPASDDDTIASTPQLPQEEILYEPIVLPSPEPFVPNPEIEPIEDFPVPRVAEKMIWCFSLEEMLVFMESTPYIVEDSEAYGAMIITDTVGLTEYYIPDPAKIPEGYELIQVLIYPDSYRFYYTSVPEEYVTVSGWLWPKETSLVYYISKTFFPRSGKIYLNDELVDGSDLVLTCKMGDNDHLIQ